MAWSIAQRLTVTPTTNTGTSITLAHALGSAVSTTNRILLFIGVSHTAGFMPTFAISDSLGSTWTQLLINHVYTASGGTTSPEICVVYTCVPASAGTMTITVKSTPTASSTNEIGWTAAEVSGLDMSAGSGCLRTSGIGTGNQGGSASTSVPCGTTAAADTSGDLALAFGTDWGDTLTWSVSGTGFSIDTGLSINANATQNVVVATKTGTGTTDTASFTYTSTATANVAEVLAIKMVSAPPTGTAAIALAGTASIGPVTGPAALALIAAGTVGPVSGEQNIARPDCHTHRLGRSSVGERCLQVYGRARQTGHHHA